VKIALLLVLSLFLVGCGNEYGIKHGSKVTVAFVGGGSMEGFMSKANGKVKYEKRVLQIQIGRPI
jgi:hypothetical protein